MLMLQDRTIPLGLEESPACTGQTCRAASTPELSCCSLWLQEFWLQLPPALCFCSALPCPCSPRSAVALSHQVQCRRSCFHTLLLSGVLPSL